MLFRSIIGHRKLISSYYKNPFSQISPDDEINLGLQLISDIQGSKLWKIKNADTIHATQYPFSDIHLVSTADKDNNIIIQIKLYLTNGLIWTNPNKYGINKGTLTIIDTSNNSKKAYYSKIELPLAITNLTAYEGYTAFTVPSENGFKQIYIYFPELMNNKIYLGEYYLKPSKTP